MARKRRVRSYIKKSRKGRRYRVRSHSRVMSKSELVGKVSDRHKELAKKDVGQVLDTTADEIGGALKKGESVRWNGLGTFKVKIKPARPARKGTNPFTGKEQMFKASPAKKVVRFKPSSEIKF